MDPWIGIGAIALCIAIGIPAGIALDRAITAWASRRGDR